ncbi:MAG: hypothetical protein IJ772_01790 [Bacilli bacterium]|nr:hypothetical protein [Bacilli bacterium]MBR1817558.1 hypothetical protein [Bacilli bacterium]
MKINTIITLDNQEKYMVLNSTVYENSNYYLVMGMDENNEVISSKVAIFKAENEGEDIYVTKVEDNDLMVTITNLLKSQIK